MADLVLRVEGGEDHDASPQPFQLRYIDEHVDPGMFSRLRSTLNTSGMVLG